MLISSMMCLPNCILNPYHFCIFYGILSLSVSSLNARQHQQRLWREEVSLAPICAGPQMQRRHQAIAHLLLLEEWQRRKSLSQ